MSLFRNAKYVSACEVEQAEARGMNYEQVVQSPRDVGKLGPDDTLIIDGNNTLFGETELAVKLAIESARSGVPVGVHAYTITPALRELLDEPLVVVAKTHRKVRAKLRRLIAARRPRSAS
jgi:hypothetical protein